MLVRLVRALWRARDGADFSATVLAVACRLLPADRAYWGEAMRTELACIESTTARRRFATGAIRATMTARLIGRRQARPDVIAILAATTACAALVAATFISVPGLRDLHHVSLMLAVLAAALASYAVLIVATTDAGGGAPAIRRWTTSAGFAIAATWIVFATAWWNLHGTPLAVAVLLPMLAAALTTRTTGSTRAGITMATRMGLIGGILVFLAATVITLATAGSPDPGRRAATVGEGLAVSTLLLLLVPCLTAVAGAAGALIARAIRVTGRRPPTRR
jgi:hypothetical protein